MPEGHPCSWVLTGLGGHSVSRSTCVKRVPPSARARFALGEMVSFWSPELVPEEGLIHGRPSTPTCSARHIRRTTLGVQGEIGAFLEELLLHLPERSRPLPVARRGEAHGARRARARCRAPELFDANDLTRGGRGQRRDGLTEAGNSFALGSHHLRFEGTNALPCVAPASARWARPARVCSVPRSLARRPSRSWATVRC